MRAAIMGWGLAAALSLSSLPASGGNVSSKEAVTITGCVHAGQQSDSFVLTDVTDTEGVADRVIYWLSTTNGLKAHVGRRVAVTGPVVKVSQGEVEIKNDPAKHPPAKVEIKARGKEVDARTTSPSVATGEKGKTEEKRPVHRIKVLSVREVAGSCK